MKDTNTKNLVKVLEPSTLNLTLIILVTVVFSVVAYIASIRPKNSLLNQIFFFFHNEAATSYNDLANKLSSVRIINDLPLIVFWALLGTIVYIIVMDIYHGFTEAMNLAEEWNYKNLKKEPFIKDLIAHSIVRILSLILLSVLIKIIISMVVPLDLSYIHKYASYKTNSSAIDVVLIALLVILILHVVTILIRMVLLRVRVFSGAPIGLK